MKFEKGSILYYRVFDIGDEVNLNLADQIFKDTSLPIRLVLSKKQRALIINEPPLVLSLGQWQYEVMGQSFPVTITGKLWSFGAFSLLFKFQLPSGISLSELAQLASQLDGDSQLHAYAVQKTKQLIENCQQAIKNPVLSEIYEDYMIFHIDKFSGTHTIDELFDKDSFYSLILLDHEAVPARQVREELLKEGYQYSKDDYALIDWNSAFIYDSNPSTDIPDVIEFALCQLLEMQYYDSILTRRLVGIYKVLGSGWGQSMFTNRYAKLRHQSAMFYQETSEIVEMVDNSLKVVGDFYYAKIFRVASAKFRFADWKQTVETKLNNVAQISKLLSDEINERRNQFMEFIIIVLIAIEAVPLVFKYVVGLFIN
jgi:hypothetical protein